MGRELPILVEQAKNAAGQRTFWLMKLTLPASGDYEAETFYISTQSVEFEGEFYDPRLKGKVQIKNILGSATDGGKVSIDNTDLEIGRKFLPKDRFIEGAEVVLRFAWKLPDGSIQADKVFDGTISGATLSMSDGIVGVSLIGDIYKPTVVLGAFPLAQRCVYAFNVNGLLSPDVSPCGWQVSQGGDPLECDHTEDGPNGCNAHFNLHRIGAIPFFADVIVEIISGLDGGSSGFPSVGSRKNPVDIDPVYI